MKVIKKKLSELKRPEKNVRMHSSKQLAEFRRSVEMFGQIRPIVIDENGVILAGNGLYETMLSMGKEEADCYVVSDLTDKEKKKLMLADNRVFNLGVDDLAVFDEIIAELGSDLDVPGYDPDLLKSLVAAADDVDDIIEGYGLISDESKAGMEKAAERYKSEESSFVQESTEVKPQQTVTAEERPPAAVSANENKTTTPATETPQKEPPAPLTRSFVVCPKCGEKIWL